MFAPANQTHFSLTIEGLEHDLQAFSLTGREAISCGIIGYSHAFGGYPGSHATYVRVPFADVNLFNVPEGVTDEQALFVSDAAPTGYFAADNADIQPGDTVAVWGCGGVGQMAICSAYLLGRRAGDRD